jgi:hypothetical protein
MNEQHDKMVEAARDEMNKAATKFIAERPAFPSANPYIPKYMADFATEQVEPFATALRALVEKLDGKCECGHEEHGHGNRDGSVKYCMNGDCMCNGYVSVVAQAKALLADTPLTGE